MRWGCVVCRVKESVVSPLIFSNNSRSPAFSSRVTLHPQVFARESTCSLRVMEAREREAHHYFGAHAAKSVKRPPPPPPSLVHLGADTARPKWVYVCIAQIEKAKTSWFFVWREFYSPARKAAGKNNVKMEWLAVFAQIRPLTLYVCLVLAPANEQLSLAVLEPALAYTAKSMCICVLYVQCVCLSAACSVRVSTRQHKSPAIQGRNGESTWRATPDQNKYVHSRCKSGLANTLGQWTRPNEFICIEKHEENMEIWSFCAMAIFLFLYWRKSNIQRNNFV